MYKRFYIVIIADFMLLKHLFLFFKTKTITQDEVYKSTEDYNAQCALQYRYAHLQQIRLLVNHGADLNAARVDGETLFTLSMRNNNVDICDVLLADENIDLALYENKYGQNILHMILSSESVEMMKRFDQILDKVCCLWLVKCKIEKS